MPNRGQLQPAHTPPRACCACPHATCRQGTVVPRAAPESSMRGLMLVNNFRGTCINVQLESLAAQPATHNICVGEGSLAHHPELYHVICYPTIYNCIKTHTRELDLSRRLFPATDTMDSALPSILHPTVRYNFMLCLTFCTFFSVSHFVGASLPVPNLILDWLTYYCVSFTFAWFMNL